jgi:membrane protease YdiL (CAAX protease family)
VSENAKLALQFVGYFNWGLIIWVVVFYFLTREKSKPFNTIALVISLFMGFFSLFGTALQGAAFGKLTIYLNFVPFIQFFCYSATGFMLLRQFSISAWTENLFKGFLPTGFKLAQRSNKHFQFSLRKDFSWQQSIFSTEAEQKSYFKLRISKKEYGESIATQITIGFIIGISVLIAISIWFAIFQVHPKSNLPYALEKNTIYQSFILFSLIFGAISEEITYRLFLSLLIGYYLGLKNHSFWIGAIISSAIWALSHTGQADPNWVKLSFIFFVGLLFNWLLKRWGFVTPVVAHVTWNTLGFFLLPR